uniref:PucR family transcriptional regulator n=1 Tax=Eubacterium cellulosolvens TaxID=29322 RepID=UPI0004835065|nr:helix-turn-helix domain-containing protein [[Eubacterium] cellulosolvens]
MISARILGKTLQELHNITGSLLTLVNRNGEIVYNCAEKSKDLSASVHSFIESAADTMYVGTDYFLKVNDNDRVEYVVIAGGENAEMSGRIAVSELQNILTVSHERSDRNHFMQNILLDNILPVDLRDEARRLKIHNDVTRTVFLTETTEADNAPALQILKAMYATSGSTSFVCSLDATHIAIVIEGTALEKQAFTIADTLNTEAMISVRVACGEPTDQLSHLSQCYKEAQLAMEVGRIFLPDRHVLTYARLGIGRLIYQLPISLCKVFLHETFERDVFSELDDETLLTIRIFFENDLNISETARQLYIHRNTLVYRLEKLQKTTGLDIRKFDEAMTFKIAMMVYDYVQHMEEKDN